MLAEDPRCLVRAASVIRYTYAGKMLSLHDFHLLLCTSFALNLLYYTADYTLVRYTLVKYTYRGTPGGLTFDLFSIPYQNKRRPIKRTHTLYSIT